MSDIVKITRVDEVNELLEASNEEDVWIFKHSLLCPTSLRTLEEFQEFAEGRQGGQYRLVEIQSARPVSAAVAQATGVEHQSPQVLLLRDGDVVWHTSHYRIQIDALEEAAEE